MRGCIEPRAYSGPPIIAGSCIYEIDPGEKKLSSLSPPPSI